MKLLPPAGKNPSPMHPAETAGFSLIETTIALLILLVAMLGVFSVFTYAVIYNTGNTNRAKALGVLQREAELIRSAKFTPSKTDGTAASDPVDLRGGEKADKTVTLDDGSTYKVKVTVDNDPATAGVQTDETVIPRLKEITIVVTPQSSVGTQNANKNWQAAIPATIVVRRVRSN